MVPGSQLLLSSLLEPRLKGASWHLLHGVRHDWHQVPAVNGANRYVGYGIDIGGQQLAVVREAPVNNEFADILRKNPDPSKIVAAYSSLSGSSSLTFMKCGGRPRISSTLAKCGHASGLVQSSCESVYLHPRVAACHPRANMESTLAAKAQEGLTLTPSSCQPAYPRPETGGRSRRATGAETSRR